MNIDSYFAIGSTHRVCEDYALSNDKGVIVADGCSHGSSSNKHKTDIGARLLALAAQKYLHLWIVRDADSFAAAITADAAAMARTLGLKIDSLAATLLALKVNDAPGSKGIISGFLCGDGVIGGKKKDGTWEVTIVEFPSNAPFYLSYMIEDGTLDSYVSGVGDKVVSTTLKGDLSDRSKYTSETDNWNICEADFFSTFQYRIDEYEFVFAATDGINSIKKSIQTETSKHGKLVPLREVLPVLLDFPNTKGELLNRAMQWQFGKNLEGTAKNLGWMHEDDLGLGVIYCGKD